MGRVHVSWVITAVSLGFLGGVAIVPLLNNLRLPAVYWLAIGFVLTILVLLSRLRVMLPVAVVAGGLMGMARAQPVLVELDGYDRYVGDEATIVGTVMDDPSLGRGVSLNVGSATMILSQGEPVTINGRVWVNIDRTTDSSIKRSGRVAVRGVLDNGFGSYVLTMSRAKLLESSYTASADPMGAVRDNFGDKLSTVLDESEAALGMGLLAGQKTALDSDIQNAFVAASLTHILVASGYNLTILVRFARRLFARHSRWLALILSVSLVLAFVGVTGVSASMTRAAIVAILSLLLWFVGRKAHPVVLLSVVAAVTIAVNPVQLWGDIGWYLSFGSFAGVIILAPLLNDLLHIKRQDDYGLDQNNNSELTMIARLARRLGRLPGSLGRVFIETASAQLLTWPIIAYVMGNVSVVGLLTNLLVLPITPLAMLITFVAGIATILLPLPLAVLIAQPAHYLLNYIIGVAEWGATLPMASVELSISLPLIIGYYGALILLMVALKVATKHNFYGDNVIE